MRRSQSAVGVLAALFLFSCTKKPEVAAPVEEPVEEEVVQEDNSELSQFRKSRKKVRKRKKTKPANPPTRQDGLAALEEGKLLVEEADFRGAERELRIAAAAGIDGADALLLRVRGEMAAEERIAAAQKKIALRDFEGARAELARVPDGYILTDIARNLAQRLEQRETEARKELLDKAAQKFETGAPDAAEEKAPEPKPEVKADEPKADEVKPAEPKPEEPKGEEPKAAEPKQEEPAPEPKPE